MESAQLEKSVQAYHQLWCNVRKSEGWTVGRFFEHTMKISPLMDKWERLSVEHRTYFRQMVSLAELAFQDTQHTCKVQEPPQPRGKKLQLKIPVKTKDGVQEVTTPFTLPSGEPLVLYATKDTITDGGVAVQILETVAGRKLSGVNRRVLRGIITEQGLTLERGGILQMKADTSNVACFLTFAQGAIKAIELRHRFRTKGDAHSEER